MKRLVIAGIVIVLFLLSFQYYVVFKEQTALPSEDWSRAYSIDLEPSNYTGIQSVPSDSGYTVSLIDLKNDLTVVSCGPDMACKLNRKLEKINTYKNTWSDNHNTYYIKFDKLNHWENGKESIVAEEVEDFIVNGEKLIYWNDDHEVTVINRDTLEVIDQFTMDLPLYSMEQVGSRIFIVLADPNRTNYPVYLYDGKLTKLFTIPVLYTESLLDVNIVAKGNDNHYLFFRKKVTEGGGTLNLYLTAPFNLQNSDQQISPKLVNFQDKESGDKLQDIINVAFYQLDESTRLTFSAATYDLSGNKIYKLYTGDYEEESLLVTPLTKKSERYSRPEQIADDTILFFRLKGNERYLNYASSDPAVVADSSKVREGDYKESMYQLITVLSKGLLLVLLSFIWLIPGLAIVYGIQNIWKRNDRSISLKWLVAIYSVSLLCFQAFAFMKIMNGQFMIANTPYISTAGQFVGLLLLSMVLTVLPIVVTRMKIIDDHFNSIIFYISLLNLTALFVLIGPYMI